MRAKDLCLIGFGEVGGIFAADFAAKGCRVAVYDILVESEKGKRELSAKAQATGAALCSTLPEAIAGADLLVSAVTASSSGDVARASRPHLKPGQCFLDINSISPRAKQENAREIEGAGALFVEAAVMAPVPPQRLKVPILLGGERAPQLSEVLNGLGMNTKAISDRIGVASAIKMCRSVMIKGLEALTVECLFAARRYGAEDAVLASLHASFPSLGWTGEFPDYLVSRVAEHGRRRAAEMREVATTLREVGIDPTMAMATSLRQDALVDEMQRNELSYRADAKFSWRALADELNR